MYIPEIGMEGNVNAETVLSLSESQLFVGLFFFLIGFFYGCFGSLLPRANFP